MSEIVIALARIVSKPTSMPLMSLRKQAGHIELINKERIVPLRRIKLMLPINTVRIRNQDSNADKIVTKNSHRIIKKQ